LQYSEGPNGTGVMRYRKLLLEDAPITQIPQTFEQLCNAVALKPAERYGFDISGRQGSAIFISFTSWLCPSGGGTVNFDTDEVLINNPAPGEADLRRVRTVAARRSARVRSVPEVSETGAGRRRRRLATCDWRRRRLM
jgi:hypothetical protein